MGIIAIIAAGLAGWKYGVMEHNHVMTIIAISLAFSAIGLVAAGSIGFGFFLVFAVRTALMILAYWIGYKLSARRADPDL